MGREVTVRFDPFDVSRVRLYEGGQCAQVLEPQTLVSRTYCKATPKKRKKGEHRRASSAAYRLAAWDAGCQCFKPEGGDVPFTP